MAAIVFRDKSLRSPSSFDHGDWEQISPLDQPKVKYLVERISPLDQPKVKYLAEQISPLDQPKVKYLAEQISPNGTKYDRQIMEKHKAEDSLGLTVVFKCSRVTGGVWGNMDIYCWGLLGIDGCIHPEQMSRVVDGTGHIGEMRRVRLQEQPVPWYGFEPPSLSVAKPLHHTRMRYTGRYWA
jgi:hypothetical protein